MKEQVIVCSLEKEAIIAAVTSTHLEVNLATNESIVAVSWYDVHKVFSVRAFVSVISSPLREIMGWVECIIDNTVSLLKYKEKGNLSISNFILIPGDIY